jgi:hypothetical protein
MRCKVMLIIAVTSLTLLFGCSSTTINGVWKDPDYQGGPLDRVLVVSIARQDLMRRLYEDAFVAHLQSRGITAAPGYKTLPPPGQEPPDLEGLPGKAGYRFLLATRLADKKTIEIFHPGATYIDHYPGRHYYYRDYPYYRHWGDYYRSSYSVIETTPPYSSLNELVILETNLYDASGEIIFSVQTETLIDYGANATIQDIVDAVIKALATQGLI